MKTRVICVARAMGAGGEDVAKSLSQRMGFRYVDEEIVAKAAERDGVDVQVVQDAERRRTFVERLMESFTVAPASDLVGTAGFLAAAADSAGAEFAAGGVALRGTEHFRQLIRDVVRDTAAQGNVVIVAHAAAMALAGQEGVLRVLVTASPDVRARRLAQAQGITLDKAAKAIEASDQARGDYLKAFYGILEELPTHYDIVGNTDVLSAGQLVDAVVAAAQS